MTQAIVLHALAVHAVNAGGRLSAAGPWHVLAGDVPDPDPAAPPGLGHYVNIIISWGKWAALICGFVGLLTAGGKMSIGHFQSRSTMAAEGASSIPMVLLGLSVVACASGIVAVFL